MPVTDTQLYAWLAQALEPQATLTVEEALAGDPQVRARLQLLTLTPPGPTDPWRIPPPGVLGGRARLGVQSAGAAVFDDGLRPGDRFDVRIAPCPDAADRALIVLRQAHSKWEVVFPTTPDELSPLSALPADSEGERVLSVTAAGEPGTQRWAVALPFLAIEIDWAASGTDRWSSLMEGLGTGEVPVASAEVLVRG